MSGTERDHADTHGHEQVVIGHDPTTGLHAIIAIHSTALGPALGGTRMRPYPDQRSALADVLDLSRAMTAKNAMAGLPHGGGKGVIIGDPSTDKSPELLRAYGRLVASLGGRYVTACDVGTYVADMDVIAEVNPWTTGRSPEQGGAGDSGVLTALGVHAAMRACAAHVWGEPSLSGRRVGIEGVGKVGSRLAVRLRDEGAKLFVSDVDEGALTAVRAQVPEAEVCSREELLTADLDVLAPCALGGTLSEPVIATLAARVVCGGANNQLTEPELAVAVADRGILLAPDFVVNAGGVIAVADEYSGFDPQRAAARTARIGETMTAVLERAAATATTPWQAAEQLAAQRVSAAAATRPPFRGFAAPTAR